MSSIFCIYIALYGSKSTFTYNFTWFSQFYEILLHRFIKTQNETVKSTWLIMRGQMLKSYFQQFNDFLFIKIGSYLNNNSFNYSTHSSDDLYIHIYLSIPAVYYSTWNKKIILGIQCIYYLNLFSEKCKFNYETRDGIANHIICQYIDNFWKEKIQVNKKVYVRI